MLAKVHFVVMMLCVICIFSNCASTKNKKITVTGIAYDDKDCAFIINDSTGAYYLEELDEWDEKYLGKKVKVTGRLKIQVNQKHSSYSSLYQERVGTMRIIKKPKWNLAE